MMGQVSKKFRRAENGYIHWCPGCKETHRLPDAWSFNGDLDRPTFKPSFKHTGKQAITDEFGEWTGEYRRDAAGVALDGCCHYILTDGVLDFQRDCHHALAGTKVPLPDLPAHLTDKGFVG
jgi:hypothetical protein